MTERSQTRREQAALRRIASLVADGVQPSDIFAVVAEEVARVIDVPFASVARYEPDDTVTSCATSSPQGAMIEVGSRWRLEDTRVLQLVRERSGPARLDDYDGLPGELADAARRAGIRSSVGVPIVVAGRLWGAITASGADRLPDNTEARLVEFTPLLATAIANAESHSAVVRLAEEQAALRRVATLVAHEVAQPELFNAIADELRRLMGITEVRMLRLDADRSTVVVGCSGSGDAFPVGSRHRLVGDSAIDRVFRTGRTARIDDYATVSGPVADTARSIGIRAVVAVPIAVNGRLWGAVTAGFTSEDTLQSETESRLAEFTDLMAAAIANAESRAEVRRLAEEQAALRRVATLVAQGAQPVEVFWAVSDEVGRLFGTDLAAVGKFENDGQVISLVGAERTHEEWEMSEYLVSAEVLRTGRPARRDAPSWESAEGETAERLRALGIVSTVGSPIVVEGELWGSMLVASTDAELPPGTEERLAQFTELVAMAIANAQAAGELAASRRRIVTATDEARRRIERDLHDGIQQRLIALTFSARAMSRKPAGELPGMTAELAEGLIAVSRELREVSRGIHPTILSEAGLGPALRALARRSGIPIQADVTIESRLPEPVEVAAYYVASEAIANVAKHAQANVVELFAAQDDGVLILEVRDDGVGGAEAGRGSGIVGLEDRVDALGGTISIASPPGGGTTLLLRLPITP